MNIRSTADLYTPPRTEQGSDTLPLSLPAPSLPHDIHKRKEFCCWALFQVRLLGADLSHSSTQSGAGTHLITADSGSGKFRLGRARWGPLLWLGGQP